MAKINPFTITIDDSNVLNTLRYALELVIDIESDTLTDCIPFRPAEVHQLASLTDDEISQQLREWNDSIYKRSDRLIGAQLLLSHLPASE